MITENLTDWQIAQARKFSALINNEGLGPILTNQVEWNTPVMEFAV